MRVADLSKEKRNELKEKYKGKGKVKNELRKETLVKFETVVIIAPRFPIDNDTKTSIKHDFEKYLKINELLGAKFEIEDIGLRTLTYEMQGNREGYYMVFYYKTNPSYIADLEKYLRKTQCFLKFITVRMEG